MTKGQIIYLIRNSIFNDTALQEGGIRSDPKQIEAVADICYEAIVRQEFKGDPLVLDPYAYMYLHTLGVNADTIAILYPVINVKGNNGVISVGPGNDPLTRWTRIDYEMMPALNNVEAYTILGGVLWYVDTSGITFIDKPTNILSFNVRIVRRFTSWDMDEHVPMPAGRADYLVELVKKTLLEGAMSSDMDNNNMSDNPLKQS